MYEFVCLPFGLSSAPRVFTKIMKPIFSYMRSQGISCFFYIDDSLNQDIDQETCMNNATMLLQMMEELGFYINFEKSALHPSRRIQYLGFIIDSEQFKLFLPEEKLEKILESSKRILMKSKVSIREITALIGLYNSASMAIQLGPLFHRYLDSDKCLALKENLQNYDKKICLSNNSVNEIEWWINNVKNYNGKVIRPQSPNVYLYTDASLKGWGAAIEKGEHTQGRWNYEESRLHINLLELKAIYFALLALCKSYENIHICIRSDSSTAVTYINRRGGSILPLSNEAKNIWVWCFNRNIYLSAVHIPGKENVIPDYLSREFNDCSEWMLRRDIFDKISKTFFIPKIDLFASRVNTQIRNNYVSWFPDPDAVDCDAFSLSWNNISDPYIFPPFSQLARVLQKVEDDQVNRALLICPLWTTQVWFPKLLKLLVDFPVKIPMKKDLLMLAHNQVLHPLNKRKTFLIGCCISGDTSKIRAFQNRLQKLSLHRGDTPLTNSMNIHGELGCVGVTNGILIPLHQMK